MYHIFVSLVAKNIIIILRNQRLRHPLFNTQLQTLFTKTNNDWYVLKDKNPLSTLPFKTLSRP